MTITIREKNIENDSKVLYLDIYEKGKRKFEYLDLYIIPEVDDRAKQLNDDARERARMIRSERILHPETIPEQGHQLVGDENPKDDSPLLLDWIDTYIERAESMTDLSDAIIMQSRYLKTILTEFLTKKHKEQIMIGGFDKVWFKTFFKWLKSDYVPTKYKRRKPKPLSAGTLRNLQQRIVAIFNSAVREKVIIANPIYAMDKNDTFPKPKKGTKEFLTPDELKRFMASEETSPGVVETQKAFGFACLTGLRISDVRALRWSNISMNEQTNKLIIVQKKTKAINAVPICSTAMGWLPERGDDDKVFHLPSSTCVYDNLRRIAKKVGIKKDISFHTSRHTFGTLIQAMTHNLETTRNLMGHRSIKTTEIYAEVLTKDKVKAVKKTGTTFRCRKKNVENTKIPQTKRTAATNTHPRKVVEE